jgi:hypothetical protein
MSFSPVWEIARTTAVVQLEAEFRLGAVVAIEAVFRQDRTNLLFEEFDLRGSEGRSRLRLRHRRLFLPHRRFQARQNDRDEDSGG